MPAELQSSHKFQTLDAIRGVAALAVVVFHNEPAFHWIPARGYLAVDLFFILSGFVLSYAYQSRLDKGMPTIHFLRARIDRLFPLYILVLVIGVAVSLSLRTYALPRTELLFIVGLNLFLIPVHSAAGMFPFNGPSWTLLLELAMNVVHACWLRRLRTRTLVILCALSCILLIALFDRFRSMNVGWTWDTLLLSGAARVTFSYLTGMLLFRIWQMKRYTLRLNVGILLGITLLLLTPHVPHEAIASLAITLIIFPPLVYASALTEPGKMWGGLFRYLGGVSYPVYLIHAPLSALFYGVWPAAVVHAPVAGLVLLALVLAIASALNSSYDTPVRAWIKERRTLSRSSGRPEGAPQA